MAVKTRAKAHADDALVYDGLEIIDLPSVAVVASQTLSSLQLGLIFVLPVSCKFYAIEAAFTNAAPGVTQVDCAMGSIAISGFGTPDTSDSFTLTSPGGVTGGSPPTLAVAGNAVLGGNATYNTVGAVTAYVGQFFPVPTPDFDVIFPQGAVMTARYVSGATVNGNIIISLICKPYDIIQYSPRNTTFAPSADIK